MSLPVRAHQHTCVFVPIYTCLGINNPQLLLLSEYNRSLCLRKPDLLARQLRLRGHMCASVPLRINRAQRRNTATLCASAGRCYHGGLFLTSPVGKISRVVMQVRMPMTLTSHAALPSRINSFMPFVFVSFAACFAHRCVWCVCAF